MKLAKKKKLKIAHIPTWHTHFQNLWYSPVKFCGTQQDISYKYKVDKIPH